MNNKENKMTPITIQMTKDVDKSASLKSTDVYRSSDPNAVVTNIYMKKSVDAGMNITLTVEDKA